MLRGLPGVTDTAMAEDADIEEWLSKLGLGRG
jgi:hypothetical protein